MAHKKTKQRQKRGKKCNQKMQGRGEAPYRISGKTLGMVHYNIPHFSDHETADKIKEVALGN